MSLKIRKKFFKILSKKINCRKINDLMIEIKIEKKLFDNLYNSTFDYVKKCFNTSQTIKSEKELFAFLKKNKIKNITPNGMIVPKNEVTLEFNLVVKSYIDILKSLNISNFIESFHFPPNIRYKEGNLKISNLKRKHPTEFFHSDTWTGAMPNWVASHLYIMGDLSRNHIRYAYPPDDFSENWLKPLEKAKYGQSLAKKFKIVNFKPKKGTFVFADATIIHHSYRKKNCGERISLDTGLNMKINDLKSFKFRKINKINVKKIRLEETISNKDFLNIGSKNFLYFPDHMDKKKYTIGGFKHPSNLKLIKSK